MPAVAPARGVYQEPADFLREAFADDPPAPQALWITKDVGHEAAAIMGHELGVLRVRYWMRGERSAWILEETGKEQPITLGVVVNGGAIESLRVLIYRESRGSEVRHDAFTRQFTGARLRDAHELDRPIDGVTGATLSVRALIKIARLALFFHQKAAQGAP